jgi:mannose-1-phosphate guanylyltransferase
MPTRPETGYGYIQIDVAADEALSTQKEVLKVKTFTEKPELEMAKVFLESREFYWNSGIFIWNVHTVVNALRVYQPAMAKIFESLTPYYFKENEQEMVDKLFPTCDNISIDYAVMENADEIFVLPADFGWSDLGTWKSLRDNVGTTDMWGNMILGKNVKMFESKNCIVHALDEKKVIIQGLEDYIVVEKDHQLLICRISDEQRIKGFSTV